jgi:formylglycine-generating enzyme required for sulfatase activity
MAYCQWLSKKTGKKVSLPTEAQWEWACRAGTSTPLWFGDCNTEFSKFANMADIKMKELAVKGVNPKPIKNPPPELDFEPKDIRSNDGVLHLANVGTYQANPWGLHDMHGNVAEWTRSAMAPYPYRADDGRNKLDAPGRRVIRGGGWHDRQYRSTSSYRLAFPPWQKVYNVGFRIVIEPMPESTSVAQADSRR